MQTLGALGADTMVIRHSLSGAPYLAAAHTSSSVINAGDGWHAHPTQALLDLYTIRERFGRVEGLTVVIVGDVLHSRVARSDIWGLTRMGARVVLSAPHSLLPDLGVDCPGAASCDCGVHLPSVTVEPDLDRAIEGADVVMALRMQRERQTGGPLPSLREDIRRYQVDRARLARARAGGVGLHPRPVDEGGGNGADVARGGPAGHAREG